MILTFYFFHLAEGDTRLKPMVAIEVKKAPAASVANVLEENLGKLLKSCFDDKGLMLKREDSIAEKYYIDRRDALSLEDSLKKVGFEREEKMTGVEMTFHSGLADVLIEITKEALSDMKIVDAKDRRGEFTGRQFGIVEKFMSYDKFNENA